MPDWFWSVFGVLLGVGLGLALGYLLLVWYFARDRTW